MRMRCYNLIRPRRFLNNNQQSIINNHLKAPSSAPRRTCIVSDSGGSTGSAPARLQRLHTPSDRPSPVYPQPSLSSVLFVTLFPKKAPITRRRYCSSCTYSTENPRVYGILLNIPSKPNFQTPRLSVILAMIRTYNDNCPKKHKKSKPNPNPVQTQTKPNPNPIRTQSEPNPNPISNFSCEILLKSLDVWPITILQERIFANFKELTYGS